MKMTKTFAALGILGAALFAFAACKDSSGDALITGAPSASGVPTKYALQLTVDSTGNNIKVGDKAIKNSNELTEGTIIADNATGEGVDDNLKLSATGKRAFKEITAGLNNTEGFRTNIVLDLKNGTWKNGTRTAGAGMLFDFNKYKVNSDETYDFFFLSFKPMYKNDGTLDTGKIQMNFERYTEVKKLKEGIYSNHDEAKCLGKCFVQSSDYGDAWGNTAAISNIRTYYPTTGFTYDAEAQTITIGVDVKQLTKGLYNVRIGKIKYVVGDVGSETEQTFTPEAFKQSWHTKFPSSTALQVGTCGDPEGATKIENYTKWKHVGDNSASNLKGAVLVYGFAPYGTKPVACYYTCNTKLSSDTVDNTDSRVDFVGDWNRANELDASTGNSSVIYEEGNVIHEYYYY